MATKTKAEETIVDIITNIMIVILNGLMLYLFYPFILILFPSAAPSHILAPGLTYWEATAIMALIKSLTKKSK